MNKLTATFFMPKGLTPVGETVPGEFPKQLNFTSRVIPNSLELNNQRFSIKINTDPGYDDLSKLGFVGSEAVDIEILSMIPVSQQALDSNMGNLEAICDNLAFRMQMGIYIRSLRVQKINEENKEEGPGIMFPFPYGYQPEKFMQAISPSQVGETSPKLEPEYFTHDNITCAVLKWYHKGLIAPFEIDKFIFFFIACEILCGQNQTRVSQYYKNKCNHEIRNCPVCNESTERVVNGASIKMFLEEECNVSPIIARQIWNYRQILHGSNDAFKPSNNLSQLVVELQAAITERIKTLLSISQESPPHIQTNAPVMANFGFTTSLKS
jgi:hypothetical protein